jgi:hypothetical protein
MLSRRPFYGTVNQQEKLKDFIHPISIDDNESAAKSSKLEAKLDGGECFFTTLGGLPRKKQKSLRLKATLPLHRGAGLAGGAPICLRKLE